MRLTRAVSNVLALAAASGLVACASVNPANDPAILSEASISVVTAAEAGHGQGPHGISDRFTTDGVVYAFVSMVWPTTHNAWGAQTFESRWYSADRLVVQRSVTLDVHRTPFNFWSSVFLVNLGPGPARYELYANGRKLAEKSFLVVAPVATSHSGMAVSKGAG